METDRGTIVETYELVVSTFPVPPTAVVLSVVDDVSLIDSDGASIEGHRESRPGGHRTEFG